MTDSREQLRQRFRATLATRVQFVTERLAGVGRSPARSPERVEILGELHTLKGEARMLGWSTLASLVHSLEDHLRVENPDIEALAAVLDAMLLSLAPGTSDASAEEIWQTSKSALGDDPADDPEASDTAATFDQGPSNEGNEAGPKRTSDGSWVQVSAQTVEKLCEALANLSADVAQFSTKAVQTAKQVGRGATLEQEAERLKTLLSEALLFSLDLRLTPIEPLLNRIAAQARLLAADRGKAVKVSVRSGGVLIERSLIEGLSEPLMHLASNAIDHGIEEAGERAGKDPQAQLVLSAEGQGAHVLIVVEDDGRGIDESKLLSRAKRLDPSAFGSQLKAPLELLFEPGFSTRDVVDEVSGRGVGLDVVKRRVEAMHGSVSVQSELGRGTRFALSVPASLTQERLLIAQVGSGLYGIPGHVVLSVEQFQDGATFSFQGQTLPRRSLSGVLGAPASETPGAVCILAIEGRKYAVDLERVLGHSELIRRPTGPRLASLSGISGSAHTDDGRLVLLLDPLALRKALERPQGSLKTTNGNAQQIERSRILVVDDSVVVRDLLSEVLTTTGYQVRTARDGREALSELDTFLPHLVLSDIEMPEMDGFRLLEAIRRRLPTLPVVLVTARSSEADRKRAGQLGATAYVAKGEFQSENLVEVVHRLLEERS